MAILYRVVPERPHEHLFRVEARYPAPSGTPLELWMPVWTPGSYLIREFARHVHGFEAADRRGRPLTTQRVDKCTWRIEPSDSGEVAVRYLVYANELTVRTSHLDQSHGFFNGANLFMAADALRLEPCELEVAAPQGWNVHCALPRRGDRFLARDFDELVDSPVEMGPAEAIRFTAAGKPHDLVVWGRGNFDPAALARDLRDICEAEARLFGPPPVERYLFIVHLAERGRGGLEHAASTALLYPRFGFSPRKSYEDFLSLAAHEYFHLWNVKRIKPKAFVPFDYRAERATRLLWAMEGITSYYDTLLLRRAGLLDPDRTLGRLGEVISALEGAPSRRVQTLEDASLTAWIKHYRPDENTPNTGLSYYVKGEAVALLTDLALRSATGGARSLDDVMRLLFERYGDGRGVPEDGVERAVLEVGGPGLAPFLERSLRSTEELDYSPLAAAGLALKRRPRRGPADKGGMGAGDQDGAERAWLGVDLKPGDRAVVATAFSGSPAAEAGLYADDEIIALDGFRAAAQSLCERLENRRPGERARLHVFRRDELLEVELTLGARPRDACWLERVQDASAGQRAIYERWLEAPFEARAALEG
jgi:predicted metalloprotease with PDZ domain